MNHRSVECKTIRQKNIYDNTDDFEFGDDFLDMTPKAHTMKEIIDNIVKVKVKSLSRVQLFVTPWTTAYQAPPFMGFSRQECWSGLPFPSPGYI